ncbi:MAG: Uncharacterized protein JWR07_1874 [Nevskia sp.]|nr:Uncharacterized protein [Nevskia sp.]
MTDTKPAAPVAASPTDEQVIELCTAAGIQWIAPFVDEPSELDFPGSFDMVTMAEMKRLVAALREPSAPLDAKKLWLWKNFVDDRPEYWAFDNPYPINLDNGDPQTLGEPCGYAIFKPSRQGRTDVSEEQVLRAMRRAAPVAAPPVEDGGLAEMRARKDAAYEERNKVVAALARSFPSGVARTAIEGWSDDWHGCVYIDLPTGQVSWHFHDSHAHLFTGLPPYSGTWDGHNTPEKYRRLAALNDLCRNKNPQGCWNVRCQLGKVCCRAALTAGGKADSGHSGHSPEGTSVDSSACAGERTTLADVAVVDGREAPLNPTQELERARRHGYLDALSAGTARHLVALLQRGVKQLDQWHKTYGAHQPEWLPPAGDVRWMEDVAKALANSTTAPPAKEVPASRSAGTNEQGEKP